LFFNVALSQTPWQGEFNPIEGIILHESMPDPAIAAKTSRNGVIGMSAMG